MTRLFAHRTKSVAAGHAEWLSLVEPVGAFLTVPVLKRVFANGLDRTDNETRAEVRLRLDELGRSDTERTTWLRWVLGDLLGLADVLREGPAVPAALTHTVAEHSTTLRPDLVVPDSDGMATRLLVCRWPLGTKLDQTPRADPDGRPSKWSASPIERASTLCRNVGVPLALVTDTDRFALVWAPKDGAGGYGTFVSSLFGEERELLDAFCSLLGSHRCFAVAQPDTLEALFAESGESQAEVTNQLGKQVREAVELLIGAFSRAHRNSGLKLLAKVPPEEVYSAAVTVMMRLVVLLSAEERRLLPVDDELYVSSYAVSSLRDQLDDERLNDGEDAFERRSTAWFRLLAAFRAVHGGLRHDRLTLPAYGSALFDPDRYPFLEGRAEHGGRPTDGSPLPVDDLTVLAILDALQVLTFRDGGVTEARRLSYRGLDVEQIGHVYEGLLDHSCTITSDLAVGLVGKKGDEAELGVSVLEEWSAAGRPKLLAELEALTGKKTKALAQLLDAAPSHEEMDRLRSACDNDDAALARVLPFAGIVRPDLRGLPTVFMPDALYVTQTSLRRDSGTEYTTKELADEVVRYALEPLVYSQGPVDGAEPWVLKPSHEILSLKVCDPAVGSGAIIVAACRYLADRLVEAWHDEAAGGAPPDRLAGLPVDDWTLEARRLVADHCLYGVDRNPMAVEMAKLSLWLTTLAKERPFTFLDHSFRAGDSLLGVTSLDQITAFHLDSAEGRRLHRGRIWDATELIAPAVDRAKELTAQLEAIDVRDIHDAEEKARLHEEISVTLDVLGVVADVVVGAALSTANEKASAYTTRLEGIRDEVREALDPRRADDERWTFREDLREKAQYWLDTDRPPLNPDRRPLHWPLCFPEVFGDHGGFDAVVGNPPYLGGTKISTSMGGAFRSYIANWVAAESTDRADLVVFFMRQAANLANNFGFLTTRSVASGDSRRVGLERLIDAGFSVYRADTDAAWPGAASVRIAKVWLARGWLGSAVLDSVPVARINSALNAAADEVPAPDRIGAYFSMSFQGSKPDGGGFVVDVETAAELVSQRAVNSEVLRPYLSGDDLNSDPSQTASRFIIDFYDMPLREAERYAECLDIVRSKVKPQRDRHKRAAHREKWWQFGEKRPALRRYQSVNSHALAIVRHTKFPIPMRVHTDQIFSDALVLICADSAFLQGVLTSEVHQSWARCFGSSLGEALRYTSADVFETFPQPAESEEVIASMESLDDYRRVLMLDHKCGVRDLWAKMHDPAANNSDTVKLRQHQARLDGAVVRSYGWTEAVAHDFVETRYGPRYGISQPSERVVVDRLLALNQSITSDASRHVSDLRASAFGGLFEEGQ